MKKKTEELYLKCGILHCRMQAWSKQLSEKAREKLESEDGIGTIEMVLILVVLIALVIIFRDRIKALLQTIMQQIDDSATSVWS